MMPMINPEFDFHLHLLSHLRKLIRSQNISFEMYFNDLNVHIKQVLKKPSRDFKDELFGHPGLWVYSTLDFWQ